MKLGGILYCINVKYTYCWLSSYIDNIGFLCLVSLSMRQALCRTLQISDCSVFTTAPSSKCCSIIRVYEWGTSKRSHSKSVGQKDWISHQRSWLLIWILIKNSSSRASSRIRWYTTLFFTFFKREWDSRMHIQENERVKLRYHTVHQSPCILRKLCPFGLLCFDKWWSRKNKPDH